MTKELKGDLSLIGVTALWGSSFPIMSLVLKDIPPFTFIAIRYILSALILALVFFKSFKTITAATVKSGVIIGATLFVGCAFQLTGLLYTTPSKSGFLTGMNVVFVPVLIALLYKKLPDKKTIIGIGLSVIGLGVMSISSNLTINKGDILTIIAALFFAVQILVVDKYTKNVDIALLTCVELLVIGILGVIPAAAVEGFKFTISTGVIIAIFYTAILCTAIAHGLQNKVQASINPTHAAIIYLAEPIFAAFFSMLIGDRLTLRTLAGGFIIMLGMLAISIKVGKKDKSLDLPA
jgi:drug/metabolite transporter (DMT)-like permease